MNEVYLAVGLWGLLFLVTVIVIALEQNVGKKKDVPTNCNVVSLDERRKKRRKIS